MKKITKIAVLCLVFAAVTAMSVSAAEYKPAITATDNGAASWWVGTNIVCTPTGDTGFTIKSIDGTANGADVAWGFTYGQLKATPYFHVEIANTEAEEESLFTKLYLLIGSTVVPFEPFTSTLENWVRGSSVSGKHVIDLKATLDAASTSTIADDTVLILFLWASNGDNTTVDTLTVNEFYLSDAETDTGDTGDTGTTGDTGSTGSTGDAGNTGAGTGAESAVAVAAGAVIAAAALIVLTKKK